MESMKWFLRMHNSFLKKLDFKVFHGAGRPSSARTSARTSVVRNSRDSYGFDMDKQEESMPRAGTSVKNFVVPEINPQILNSDRVQANKNILEVDNRVGNIQEFILSASFPLIKLWQSIISSDEDLEAKEVLDRVKQSLFCMGSTFAGIYTGRKDSNLC